MKATCSPLRSGSTPRSSTSAQARVTMHAYQTTRSSLLDVITDDGEMKEDCEPSAVRRSPYSQGFPLFTDSLPHSRKLLSQCQGHRCAPIYHRSSQLGYQSARACLSRTARGNGCTAPSPILSTYAERMALARMSTSCSPKSIREWRLTASPPLLPANVDRGLCPSSAMKF